MEASIELILSKKTPSKLTVPNPESQAKTQQTTPLMSQINLKTGKENSRNKNQSSTNIPTLDNEPHKAPVKT